MTEADRTQPKGQWPGPSPVSEAEHEARAWGPGRAFGGLAAVIGLVVAFGTVVFAVEPPPTFDPVAVATAPNRVLALDADAEEVIRLVPRGDELVPDGAIDVEPGSDYLAAAAIRNEGEVEIAVADGASPTVELSRLLVPYGTKSANRSESRLVDAGADVRAVALSASERPILAVATISGEVVVYDVERKQPRELDRIDIGVLPEAIAVGDLDGNGASEVIVGTGNGAVTPYSENAAGWRPGRPLELDGGVDALGAGRLDGDPTIAAASGEGDEIQLLDPAGTGELRKGPSADIGAEVRSLALGPAGADGADAVVAAADDGAVVAVERTGGDELESSSEYVPRQSLGARLAQQLILAGSLILAALVFAVRGSGLASPASLGLRRALRSPWSVAAAGYVVYLASALWIGLVLQPEQEDVTRELGFGESAFGDVASGVMIVGVAAFSEELFFRGFMFGGLRRRLAWLPAAAISAAIWGLFHFTGPETVGVVVQLTVFGIVLCWIYEKTGSIWPGIALHALNNAVAFSFLTAT